MKNENYFKRLDYHIQDVPTAPFSGIFFHTESKTAQYLPIEDFLIQSAKDGLELRLAQRFPDESERAAKLMGISHLMERKLTTLSGGQLQKVALACALASGAPVLLADEPTSNLDPAAISEVRAALKVLKEQGLTIVVVEHRLHFLRGLADQVLLMESIFLI